MADSSPRDGGMSLDERNSSKESLQRHGHPTLTRVAAATSNLADAADNPTTSRRSRNEHGPVSSTCGSVISKRTSGNRTSACSRLTLPEPVTQPFQLTCPNTKVSPRKADVLPSSRSNPFFEEYRGYQGRLIASRHTDRAQPNCRPTHRSTTGDVERRC